MPFHQSNCFLRRIKASLSYSHLLKNSDFVESLKLRGMYSIVGYYLLAAIVMFMRACYLQIILGSSSMARRKILAEMGYQFTTMVYTWSGIWWTKSRYFSGFVLIFLHLDCRYWREKHPKGNSWRVGHGLSWSQGLCNIYHCLLFENESLLISDSLLWLILELPWSIEVFFCWLVKK